QSGTHVLRNDDSQVFSDYIAIARAFRKSGQDFHTFFAISKSILLWLIGARQELRQSAISQLFGLCLGQTEKLAVIFGNPGEGVDTEESEYMVDTKIME